MIGLYVALGVVAFLLLIFIPNAVKIVREYQRLVLFRLGRAIGIRGPGLVIIIPIIDRVTWVDLRELYLEIPHQSAITEDNAVISIDFIIFYKVVFFFQAEDGIRDLYVTGVQTCALPICLSWTCRSRWCCGTADGTS